MCALWSSVENDDNNAWYWNSNNQNWNNNNKNNNNSCFAARVTVREKINARRRCGERRNPFSCDVSGIS